MPLKDTEDLQKLAQKLLQINNVIIITHENPDGDAVSSVVALQQILKKNNINAKGFFSERISSKYRDFLNEDIIFGNISCLAEYQYCICLDCAKFERLGINESNKEDLLELSIINIDHHYDNTHYGKTNMVDSSCCSTNELLFRIFKTIPQSPFTPSIATSLMVGIVTDTGCFRFNNTNSEVLKIASELLSLGADYMKVIDRIFFKKPLNLYKLESYILLYELKFKFSKRFIYFYLSDALLGKYNLEKKDTEGLIDTIRTIEGVDIVAIFTEKNNGFKVSLRSNTKKLSVAEIARSLNGGGHNLAAGCFINTSGFEEAEKILIDKVQRYF